MRKDRFLNIAAALRKAAEQAPNRDTTVVVDDLSTSGTRACRVRSAITEESIRKALQKGMTSIDLSQEVSAFSTQHFPEVTTQETRIPAELPLEIDLRKKKGAVEFPKVYPDFNYSHSEGVEDDQTTIAVGKQFDKPKTDTEVPNLHKGKRYSSHTSVGRARSSHRHEKIVITHEDLEKNTGAFPSIQKEEQINLEWVRK